jgi:tetratricopeptide (TPR) repeat protein
MRNKPGWLRTLPRALSTTLPSVLLLAVVIGPANAQNSAPTPPANPQTGNAAAAATENAKQSAALIFQHGQDALNHGRLDEAEHDFRQILALDPQAGAAYANLGVVYMRRKQWTKALEMLRNAEHMMPQVAGIRLNIGLAYYHQNEFLLAIPPFESVVRDQPDALQPRYLLGLCYFFADRWADAADTL